MALSRITNYIEADGADLNLQSSDTTITDGSVLGVINFKAPSEASGTDSILLASKIEAVAEGTFSASSNATELVFFTASSEAAGTAGGGKMVMSSTGNLTLKDTRTADGSSPTITLQSGDTDIAQDDVLGTINFQAPDEATGTDAILVAASIAAISEGDFSSSSNATKLSFKTGASETAAEKMSLGSGGDLSILTDGASIFFGASSEIELRHVADDGLILKHVGTGDGKEPSLTFQAGDNDIAQDDILGSIFFQAPDEGAGTDAVLVSAGIEAISEGDFSSSSNATSLIFKTGSSEAAAEKVRLTSAGLLKVVGDGSTTTNALTVGAGDDLKIFHGGTNSEIKNGTGALLISGDDIAMNSAGGESMFSALSNDMVRLYFDNTEALRTTSGGGITIANGLTLTDGNVTFAAGHGLDFSNSTNSGADNSTGNFAELLDDYEIGNFNLTMIGISGSAGTVAGNVANMTYVKIGNMVMINGSPAITNVGSYSGSIRLTGLPFANGANHSFGIQFTWHNFNSRNDASANIYPYGSGSQTYLSVGLPDTNSVAWSSVGTGYYGIGGVYPVF